MEYHWITQEERDFQQFVENRIAEIRRLTPPALWNHCPGQSNPADIPTRGIAGGTLQDLEKWWTGPSWLKNEPDAWPTARTTRLDKMAKGIPARTETASTG